MIQAMTTVILRIMIVVGVCIGLRSLAVCMNDRNGGLNQILMKSKYLGKKIVWFHFEYIDIIDIIDIIDKDDKGVCTGQGKMLPTLVSDIGWISVFVRGNIYPWHAHTPVVIFNY